MNLYIILSLLLIVTLLEASHFRGGSVSYVANNLNVTFTVTYTARYSYYSNAFVGTEVTDSYLAFYFGDGSNFQPLLNISTINTQDDWLTAAITFTHTYATGGRYTAYLSGSARIQALKNNAGSDYTIISTLSISNSSVFTPPIMSVLPIINIPSNQPYSFTLSSAYGTSMVYSFRSSCYSCSQPPGFNITSEGIASVTGLGIGLWSAQALLTDANGNSVSTEFLLNSMLVPRFCNGTCSAQIQCSTASNCSTCSGESFCVTGMPRMITNPNLSSFLPGSNRATPVAGSKIIVWPNSTLSIDFLADDANFAASMVYIYASTIPSGSTFSAPIPCNSTNNCFCYGCNTAQLSVFTWTPTENTLGTHLICVGATSMQASLQNSQHCLYIKVSHPCGDGVCSASLNETYLTCSSDCPLQCDSIIYAPNATLCLNSLTSVQFEVSQVEITCYGYDCYQLAQYCRFGETVIASFNTTGRTYCTVPPLDSGTHSLLVSFPQGWLASPTSLFVTPANTSDYIELNSVENTLEVHWTPTQGLTEVEIEIFGYSPSVGRSQEFSSLAVKLTVPNIGYISIPAASIWSSRKRFDLGLTEITVSIGNSASRNWKYIKSFEWHCYGAWCGKESICNNGDPARYATRAPIDGVDAACRAHDLCYDCVQGKSDARGYCTNSIPKTMGGCDRALVSAVDNPDTVAALCSSHSNNIGFIKCKSYAPKAKYLFTFILGPYHDAMDWLKKQLHGVGDVHYIGTSGYFTYNEPGEFHAVLGDILSPSIQVRAQPLNNHGSVTFTTGIVVKPSALCSRIAFYCRELFELYVDGQAILLPVSATIKFMCGTITRDSLQHYSVSFENGLGLGVSFRGYQMSYSFSNILTFAGSRGLLGSFDGNFSHFITRNGTVVVDHDEFGDSWKLTNSSESIFDYFNNESLSTFIIPRFPRQSDQIKYTSPAQQNAAKKLCGSLSAVPQQICLYDFASLNAETDNETAAIISDTSQYVQSSLAAANISVNISISNIGDTHANFQISTSDLSASFVDVDLYSSVTAQWDSVYVNKSLITSTLSNLTMGTSYALRVRTYARSGPLFKSLWTTVMWNTTGCFSDCSSSVMCGLDTCGNPCGVCESSKICSIIRQCVNASLAPVVQLRPQPHINMQLGQAIPLASFIVIEWAASSQATFYIAWLPNDTSINVGRNSNGLWALTYEELLNGSIMASNPCTISINVTAVVSNYDVHLQATSSQVFSITFTAPPSSSPPTLAPSSAPSSSTTSSSSRISAYCKLVMVLLLGIVFFVGSL